VAKVPLVSPITTGRIEQGRSPGTRSPRQLLQNHPYRNRSSVRSKDADSSGDSLAKLIQELLPQAVRMRPKTNDWNSQLLEWLQPEQEKPFKQKPEFSL